MALADWTRAITRTFSVRAVSCFFIPTDPIITPEIFAQSIVDDYSLAQSYHTIITKSIQDQLSDFKAHSVAFGDDPSSPVIPTHNAISHVASSNSLNHNDDESMVDVKMERGKLGDDEETWWETWRKDVRSGVNYNRFVGRGAGETRSRKRRKVVKSEKAKVVAANGVNVNGAGVKGVVNGKEVAMSIDEFEDDDSKYLEEMRILIKVSLFALSFLYACVFLPCRVACLYVPVSIPLF